VERFSAHRLRPNPSYCGKLNTAISIAIIMSNLHDFLVEHAKFPFPPADEHRSVDTTDISEFEVGLLEREWKANHAVQDNDLVTKLCRTFQDILAETPLSAEVERYLRGSFTPMLQFNELGAEDQDWSTNPNEAHVSL
jgi:hypothetical protein